MRTSTSTLLVPPTRWKVWSTSTRRILFCVSRGMSAISSMNSVPLMRLLERADLALAACRSTASTPNSSTSMRSGVIAAALMTTNGPSARADSAWIVRAASSLPAPDGPTIRMRLLVGATFSIVWRSWLIAGDLPTSAGRHAARAA